MFYRTSMLAAAALVLAAEAFAAPGARSSAGPSFHAATAPRVTAAPSARAGGAPRGGPGTLGGFFGRTPSGRSTRPSAPYYYPYFGGPFGYGYGYGFADDPYFSPFYLDPYFNDSYFGSYAAGPGASGYGAEERWSDRGNVQLHIDPKDVEVDVDGIPSANNGRAVLNLPTGKHQFEVTRRGYRSWSLTLDVQQGVRYRLEQKLERLPKEEQGSGADQPSSRRVGELRLDVQPSDTIVDLDGRLLGMADLLHGSEALRRLPLGHHTLRFSRAGYQPVEREVDITADRPTEVSVKLEKS